MTFDPWGLAVKALGPSGAQGVVGLFGLAALAWAARWVRQAEAAA